MSARLPLECPEGFRGRYFVGPGDTTDAIARRFGISPAQLIAVNPHISNPARLFPGDVLCVPGFRRPRTCPPGFAVRLEVAPGETIFSIARLFNVPANRLIAANPHIPDPGRLFPGDILCVP